MSFLDELEISEEGRGGTITYREGDHRLAFAWEFAVNGVLVFVPSTAQWDANAPWAAGRRAEVLLRVAEGVKWRKAPGATYTIDEQCIDMRF